jgi:hypothetical protein
MIMQPVTQRRCGDCQLCCKLLPTREVNKPANTRCQHQRAHKGCAIYEVWPLDRCFRKRVSSIAGCTDPEVFRKLKRLTEEETMKSENVDCRAYASEKIAVAITEDIKPLLTGSSPDVQGAILTELVALYLAGFPRQSRDDRLRQIVTSSLQKINAVPVETQQ